MGVSTEPHRSILSSDIVLRAYLKEFEVGTRDFGSTRGPDSVDAARRLCVLSRDILFRIGAPCDEPASLANYLVGLFREAADLMAKGRLEDPVIEACRSNIQQRAEDIERSCVQSPRAATQPD